MARTDPAVRRTADKLSRPGPHGVLRGDLALVGMPGVIFAPQSGLGLPAVAFGHGWLQPTSRYEELLRHLASWGVVAAAPATQPGVLPSHRQFAVDLRTALDVCVGVPLSHCDPRHSGPRHSDPRHSEMGHSKMGDGAISVDPGKLGLVGHGMGGACAVLAAAADDRCRAVATLALAETMPSAVAAARDCTMPGMHLAAGLDRVAPPVGHAQPVAKAWGGPVHLQTLPKASHLGFLQGKHWTDLLVDGSPEYNTRRLSRALVTAFLLHHLTGTPDLAAFWMQNAEITGS